MTNLEKIENAVYKAIPSKKELKFGCQIEFDYIGIKNIRTIVAVIKGDIRSDTQYIMDNSCSLNYREIQKIIGTPITPLDLLKVLPYPWMIKSVENGV